MISKKDLSTKYCLETLDTDVSILDPELYRSTIAAIIAEIRTKYNGPELKELVVNIHRLEEYNMYKLARCNRQLERQASFSFKLTEIENLLEKYNICFLKILEDSPDYRLDDLYRRFVHINHKLSELDPDHMKIFGGNISEKTTLPGKQLIKSNEKLKAQIGKNNTQYNRLLRMVECLEEENIDLKNQIEAARVDTETVINELMRFKESEKEYQQKICNLEINYHSIQKQLQAKDEMLRQKDQLAENYKTSIQKLKLSLLTPTKFTKSTKEKQTDLAQKIGSTVQTAIMKAFESNTARQPLIFRQREERTGLSPEFRSQKGSTSPKNTKTPPKPPSLVKLNGRERTDNDLWSMLLVQCASLQQMLSIQDE